MATSNSLLLLTVTFALAMVVCNCRADLINDVCSKSKNAAFCNKALRSDPRSKGADLKGIATIVIEKSQNAVQATRVEANRVEYPGIRSYIATCINGLNGAKEAINDCNGLIQKVATDPSVKQTIGFRSSMAFDQTATCLFEPKEPANLSRATHEALDLINVLITISTIL